MIGVLNGSGLYLWGMNSNLIFFVHDLNLIQGLCIGACIIWLDNQKNLKGSDITLFNFTGLVFHFLAF